MFICDFALTEVDDDRTVVYGCELGNTSCRNCDARTKPTDEWDLPIDSKDVDTDIPF